MYPLVPLKVNEKLNFLTKLQHISRPHVCLGARTSCFFLSAAVCAALKAIRIKSELTLPDLVILQLNLKYGTKGGDLNILTR